MGSLIMTPRGCPSAWSTRGGGGEKGRSSAGNTSIFGTAKRFSNWRTGVPTCCCRAIIIIRDVFQGDGLETS